MMHRALLCICTIAVLISFSLAQSSREKQDRRLNPQVPLQAELLAPVDANKLSLGASVFAKARVDWNDPACHLRTGSVVTGHIVAIEKRTKQSKGSSLTIAFDHADCDGRIAPIQFTLFAIIAAPEVDEGMPLRDSSTNFGTSSTQPHMSLSGGGGGSTAHAPMQIASKDDMSLNGKSSDDKTPKVILAGQVIGLKKITLSVGTGPDGASVLTSLKDNIRLEGATQLVLMPRGSVAPTPKPSVAENSTPPNLTAAATPPPPPEPKPVPLPPPPPPEIDETSICTAPCTLVPDSTDLAAVHASRTLSTAAFGFIPHDTREYAAFDYESTLTYLDARNLLFTYDPHKLRQRFPAGLRTESMRTVRAVLLDPATLKIKKMVDWQIQGDAQFIWRAAPGQILVHLGHHLRLLDANLNVLREASVPGQLVFVSASPSGSYVAVGTLHERHTPTMHEQLAQDLHVDPEEDIDVQLFDQNFTVLLTTRQSSSLPPPTLSDAGEIRVNSIGRDRWRIRELRWDHTEHTIANINSVCHPNISTPLPDSVFLVGCTVSPLQNWYRLIRLDGRPILNGRGSSEEIEQSSSSSNQDDFAVRVVRAHSAKARGAYFRKEDLKEQEVSVYRASDGKRLFFSINPAVSLAEQSFALAPDGKQLAILTHDSISLYPITHLSPKIGKNSQATTPTSTIPASN
jgi:hypothetical protein